MTRRERVMAGAVRDAAFYRYNPHRFAADYLHLTLKLFQKILLVMMNLCTSFVFIACRGLGKTYLIAVFCCVRGILYPGTKIVLVSGTRGQAMQILSKIMLEIRPHSPELALEIDDRQSKVNGTDAMIVFKNGSFIKVVTAGDSARGSRANILIIDEFRLVKKDIVDTVLRKFLTNSRMPLYSELSQSEREKEYAKERNKTLYLSSAYFSDHWSYQKCVDNLWFMLDENRSDFVCGFPYQLSIREGLLRADDVADQMAESDFSEIKWSMEMEALFYGSAEDAFFDFDSISKNRQIRYPMYPARLAAKLNNDKQVRIQPKQPGEVRLLSADIALMSSKKNRNDATSIFINQLRPSKSGRYMSNIIYADSAEGLHTEDQALEIRRLYDEFSCDYIVLDSNGIGLGVFDCLAREMVDHETGEIYPALSCCNDKTMADRCTVPGAEKAIWSIKAGTALNSDCAYLLREGFRSGKIRLLISEYDMEEALAEIKGYNNLEQNEKVALQMPYIHTALLVDELVKLQHDTSDNRVRIYERSGMRKDRYSSLSYNYYVATQLEAKLSRFKRTGSISTDKMIIRAPSYGGKKVNDGYGRESGASWKAI